MSSEGQTIAISSKGFYIGVAALFTGVSLTQILFVIMRPSGVLGYLIAEVPLLIGTVWGGCWTTIPELYRLNEGARNAPSLRRLYNLVGLSVVLIAGSSLGPLDTQNVIERFFQADFYFPSIIFWASAAVTLAAVYSLGIVAIISRRIPYLVYPSPARGWPLRRMIAAVSFVLMFVSLYLMALRDFVPFGVVFFLGGIITRGASGRIVSKPVMPSETGRGSLPPPVELETGKVGFEQRLALGKKTSDRILQKYGKKILAVCLWGPSASEKEESVSYLDVLVIVKAGEASIPHKTSVCEGIEVGVGFWDESSIMDRARDFDEAWPAYRSRFLELKVLYERDTWTRSLQLALEESDRADPTSAIRDEALDMVRHMGTLRDDLRASNSENIRQGCSEIADSAVNLVLLLNHEPYPIRDFWTSILEMPAKPADLRPLINSAKGNAQVGQQEMLDDTLRLADQMLEMVRLRGISIESPEPLV